MQARTESSGARPPGADVEALAEEFQGVFGTETIERFLAESQQRLADARGGPVLPLLARRLTWERLRALGQSEAKIAKDVPEVLFVCVHNAGRSQMAAALLASAAGDSVHIRTAGSEPAEHVNPAVLEAMGEVGLDLGTEFPKPLSNEFVDAADVIVTMGCGDACPIYSGKRYLDWDLPDPEQADLETVRLIRDEIATLVADLLVEIRTA